MTAPTTNRPDLAILGLGCVGLTLAVEAARAGLEVAGCDPDQEVVTAVCAGRATGCGIHAEDMGRLHRDGFVATSQVAAVPTADTYAICVPTGVAPDGTPDLSAVEQAAAAIRMQAHTAYRALAAPRRTMVDAVDLAALGSGSHEQADSPPVGLLNAMTAGYRAHERRVGREPHPIDHGQREARDAR